MARRKKPRTGVPRRYTFKLHPTSEQAEVMREHARMCAELWNALIQRQHDNYRRWTSGLPREIPGRAELSGRENARARTRMLWRSGRAEQSFLTDIDLGNEVSALRDECPEWQALSTWTPRRVVTAHDLAWRAFFAALKRGDDERGPPRFRSTRDANWIPYRGNSGFRLERDPDLGGRRGLQWRATLPGVPGLVSARGRLPAIEIDECPGRGGRVMPPDHVGAPIKPRTTVHEWGDADIREERGGWWLSVQVEVDRVRLAAPRGKPRTIRLDLVDAFAVVDGEHLRAADIGLLADDLNRSIEDLQRRVCIEMGVAHDSLPDDRKWPKPLRRELQRLYGRATRRRREALHVWTTGIVAGASRIVVIRPADLKKTTKSGRGTKDRPGAAVATKAELNRLALGMAPGAAVQMLAYKAMEAQVPIEIVNAEIAADVGNDLVASSKAVRRGKRAVARVRKELSLDF